jgi:regulatory protein
MFESTYTFLEAKAKLESLCAYQERCQFEIDQKLISWKFPPDQRDQLIADLITNNFINEQRFAEAFVSGKFNIKKWGRIKITSHLKQKLISNYSIQKGLKEIDQDQYWSTIVALAFKKKAELSSKKGNLWDHKAKTYRFLQSKGYESDICSEAIKEAYN